VIAIPLGTSVSRTETSRGHRKGDNEGGTATMRIDAGEISVRACGGRSFGVVKVGSIMQG
jgi:hypothetical protein